MTDAPTLPDLVDDTIPASLRLHSFPGAVGVEFVTAECELWMTTLEARFLLQRLAAAIDDAERTQ